jgi:hypothetical protein
MSKGSETGGGMAIILDIVYCVLFFQTQRLFVMRCKEGKVTTQMSPLTEKENGQCQKSHVYLQAVLS